VNNYLCMLCIVPLAGLMLLRDGGLLLSGFYIRYKSLPRPLVWKDYFDPTVPSVLITPSLVSKINTGLQMVLLGGSLLIPIIGLQPDWLPLHVLQWTVAGTTLWSGLSYIRHHRQVVRYLHK
jgi:cardiolipin synthase